MATKPQAKAAVDNAAAAIKADIDSLPAGTNITDGVISFGPIRYSLLLTVPDVPAANTLSAAIQSFLTAQSRPFRVSAFRRESDPRVIEILETPGPAIFVIKGF